ncbi:MAG TPA: hypothetical protein VK306_11840 [Acidimicrobiales bacterium]|nr:hypothetical protein [Acidimicrobiales bacterium]
MSSLPTCSIELGSGGAQFGEPVDSNKLGYHWRRATRRAGVDGVRFHDLRHVYASMLIAAGCSVKRCRRRSGTRRRPQR